MPQLLQVIADPCHDDLQRPQNYRCFFGSFTAFCLGQVATYRLKLVHNEDSESPSRHLKQLANPHLCAEVKGLQTSPNHHDELLVQLDAALTLTLNRQI